MTIKNSRNRGNEVTVEIWHDFDRWLLLLLCRSGIVLFLTIIGVSCCEVCARQRIYDYCSGCLHTYCTQKPPEVLCKQSIDLILWILNLVSSCVGRERFSHEKASSGFHVTAEGMREFEYVVKIFSCWRSLRKDATLYYRFCTLLLLSIAKECIQRRFIFVMCESEKSQEQEFNSTTQGLTALSVHNTPSGASSITASLTSS